jgi:hypothetical protein
MAWITPKTDWAPSNGILYSDLNRIESNIEDNREEISNTQYWVSIVQISGQFSYADVPTGGEILMRRYRVLVPPMTILNLRYTSVSLDRSGIASADVGVRIKCDTSLVPIYSEYSDNYSDQQKTLHTNATASGEYVDVKVYAINRNPDYLGTINSCCFWFQLGGVYHEYMGLI